MPAVSKAQQRFMGMVHAAQKGEEPASPEVAKVASDMKKSDAKDFASTSHKGLPDHVKEAIKNVIREVLKEKSGIFEMSQNDVHFKDIMKLYDRGGTFTKKKVGVVVCKNPKASRKDIIDSLLDMDYHEITDAQDELGLKEIRKRRLTEASKLVYNVNAGEVEKFLKKYPKVKQVMDALISKNSDIMKGYKAFLKFKDKQEDYLGGRAEVSSSPTFGSKTFYKYDFGGLKGHWPEVYQYLYHSKNESVNEGFKHLIHVDTPTQVVSKPVAAQIMALAKKGVRANEIGLEMGFVGNQKLATDAFQKVKNQIYFSLHKHESVNEGLSKDAIVRTLTSDKNAYFLTKDGDGWILDITPKGAQKSTFHQKFGVKDLGKGHLGMKYKLTKESIEEEHDCGCNENHDCGCGGLHKH